MRLHSAPVPGRLPDGFLGLPGPEDPGTTALAFSARNPWFATGRAHAFCVPGAARAAAFRPPGLEVDGVPAAFFGFWETNGFGAADRWVMDAVREWARGEGARLLLGPIDFSTAGRNRLRLDDGADRTPFAGEPVNPPGYPAALEALGLRVYRRYVTDDLAARDIAALATAGAPAVAEVEAAGYTIDAFGHEYWTTHADELFELCNAVFADNLAFTPLTRTQFDETVVRGLALRTDPELSVLARGPEGDVAGVILVYPHAAAQAVLRTGGVGAAHRRRRLALAMTGEVARRATERALDRLLVATMREDNASRRLFRTGHREQRWYALYACAL